MLFQTSDTTWQAYNAFGGYSIYEGLDGAPKAVQVSYARPFLAATLLPSRSWRWNAFPPISAPRAACPACPIRT